MTFRLVKASRKSSNPVYSLIFQPPPPEFLECQSTRLNVWDKNSFLPAAGENRGENFKLDLICSTWSRVLSVYTVSTMMTMKGHCGVDQYLTHGSSGGGGGRGAQSGTCTWRAVGWGLTAHAAQTGRSEHGGLATFRVNGGIMRRGDRRYENIILANYSPASLVLSKILWSKKYKGSTPLKNYSFKYLQKQLYYSIWTNSSVKALVNSDTRIPPHICIIHPTSHLSYSIF